MVMDPDKAKKSMPHSTEATVELYCDTALITILVPLFFNIMLICGCAVYGFLTRKLPENFNESWYIFLAVSTTLFLWLAFIPTYATAYLARNRVTLQCTSLILNAALIIFSLYMPKIYAILFVDESTIKVLKAPGTSTREESTRFSYREHSSKVTPVSLTVNS